MPGFFGQAERTAMLTAANLANIKVLQLINDYTAVAMNYGIFRRKEINETAQYFVFYDMGAHHTTTSVVSYQLVKDKVTRETKPLVQVLGVGYDRTLGGIEMQIRLRDHLAREFNKMKKTKTDVFTNARAMAKLFKEAERVKNVLSANNDHFAQIEGLIEEKDFKVQVTREKLEELCKDLFDRVTKPLDQALKASQLPLDVIQQVTLFGGGSRVPKIQEILKNHIKRDLGKNINMDEAACMGAVYKAADLATGFRVAPFGIKEAVVFPIQVTFEREGNSGNQKLVKRNLFTAMGSYPQKKVITFNKNTEDFTFHVRYDDLEHLPQEEIERIGEKNLLKIQLKEVAKIIGQHQGDNVEPKGIKAHFSLDDSGLFSISGTEFVADKTVTEADEESSLSKLGSTITKLFSSGDAEKKPEEGDKPADSEKTADGEKPTEEKPADDGKQTTEKAANESTQTNGTDAAVNATEEAPKVITIKEPIPHDIEIVYVKHLKGEDFEAARKKVDTFNELERQVMRRESALNALESFVIEANLKLDEEEYASCSTPEEIESIRKACAEVSDWIYEDGENADAETYEKKLSELQEKLNPVYARHWEHRERPDVLKSFKKMIDGASEFLTNAKNLTKETNPDKDIFTPVEIDTLSKAITDAETWKATEEKAQNKLQKHETITLTVKSISDRMSLLDREVKYLVSKMKIWKPKVVPKKPKKANESEPTIEGEASGGDAEATIDEPTVTGDEVPPVEAKDETITPDKTSDKAGDSHTEL